MSRTDVHEVSAAEHEDQAGEDRGNRLKSAAGHPQVCEKSGKKNMQARSPIKGLRHRQDEMSQLGG